MKEAKVSEKKITKNEGYAAQTQGNIWIQRNDFFQAAVDYTYAALCYCDSDEGANLMALVEGLAEDCLPKLTKKNLEEHNLKTNLDNLLGKLKRKNIDGYITSPIKTFEKALKETKNRENV